MNLHNITTERRPVNQTDPVGTRVIAVRVGRFSRQMSNAYGETLNRTGIIHQIIRTTTAGYREVVVRWDSFPQSRDSYMFDARLDVL